MAARGNLDVILRTLRAGELKRLSFLGGLHLTGRKEDLITRLAVATSYAAVPSKSRPGPVVLSIDLGIRNLAYSVLTPVSSPAPTSTSTSTSPSPSPSTSRKAGAKSKKSSVTKPPPYRATSPPTIELHAWQRLSLLEASTATSAEVPDKDVDASGGAFAPAALAKTANTFLRNTVLKLEPTPTHILIERQRWRSGNSAAIQEWTVRVNTLEAMLHASLDALRDSGIWSGEVISIPPQRVGQFFFDAEDQSPKGAAPKEKRKEDESGDGPAGKSSKKRASSELKKLKIKLLDRWLGQGDLIVRPGNAEVGHMLAAYRDAPKVGTKRGRSKSVTEEDGAAEKTLTLDKKLDDLTDSLMQGMAWLRWQENVALLGTESGIKQLLK